VLILIHWSTPRKVGYTRDILPVSFVLQQAAPTQDDSREVPANGTALDLAYNFNLGAADNGGVTSVTNNLNTGRTQTFTYGAKAAGFVCACSMAASDFDYKIWVPAVSQSPSHCKRNDPFEPFQHDTSVRDG
jgi:hypothetical protein